MTHEADCTTVREALEAACEAGSATCGKLGHTDCRWCKAEDALTRLEAEHTALVEERDKWRKMAGELEVRAFNAEIELQDVLKEVRLDREAMADAHEWLTGYVARRGDSDEAKSIAESLRSRLTASPAPPAQESAKCGKPGGILHHEARCELPTPHYGLPCRMGEYQWWPVEPPAPPAQPEACWTSGTYYGVECLCREDAAPIISPTDGENGMARTPMVPPATPPPEVHAPLAAYIERQREWSRRTFGDGRRTVGICKHIEKELVEIQVAPLDVKEWVDVAILALDGAWRTGATPSEIVAAFDAKQAVNFARTYPMPTSEDEPSEHVRPDNATIQAPAAVARAEGEAETWIALAEVRAAQRVADEEIRKLRRELFLAQALQGASINVSDEAFADMIERELSPMERVHFGPRGAGALRCVTKAVRRLLEGKAEAR